MPGKYLRGKRMSKIYGDTEVIKKARDASPGDKTVYVNWEAINELPEEYEVVVTEITFDPKHLEKDFTNVGTSQSPSWMPTTQLMYRIAEACGISGGENSIVEPLIEEVDINPMLLKPMEDESTYRKMKVGAKVVKYATRFQEDGTTLRSSPCTSEFNVWERCQELWAKEENYTEGYTKPPKYPNKYDTKYKRRMHFQSELKFAHAKAETKAYMKAIRELAGLMTGYQTQDLKDGRLIFAKVRRSREVLRMETAARLQGMSKGNKAEETVQKLFGEPVDRVAENLENKHQPETGQQETEEPQQETFNIPTEPETETEPKKSKREHLIAILKNYREADLIVEEYANSADNIIKWLSNNEDAENNTTYWPKAIRILQDIEAKIPEEGKILHNLY